MNTLYRDDVVSYAMEKFHPDHQVIALEMTEEMVGKIASQYSLDEQSKLERKKEADILLELLLVIFLSSCLFFFPTQTIMGLIGASIWFAIKKLIYTAKYTPLSFDEIKIIHDKPIVKPLYQHLEKAVTVLDLAFIIALCSIGIYYDMALYLLVILIAFLIGCLLDFWREKHCYQLIMKHIDKLRDK